MNEFELWLYRGLIAVLLGVVWYFIQSGFSGIRNDIKELIAEVKRLNEKNASNDVQFKFITEKLNDNNNKIEDLQKDVKQLQINQASKN